MSEMCAPADPISRLSDMTKFTITLTSSASRFVDWFARMTP